MDNLEIERKFLLDLNKVDLNNAKCMKRIYQSYIYIDDYTEIRVRKIVIDKKEEYIYTIKIQDKNSLVRKEIEFSIDKDKYNNLIKNLANNTNIISKDRYLFLLSNNLTAEVDIYNDNLAGLKTVEVEFNSEELANNFEKPDWFYVDITNDKDYKNKNLSKVSYRNNSEEIKKLIKKYDK